MNSTIVDYFISLVRIDSESRNEFNLAQKIKKDLEGIGAKVEFDNAHEQTKGNCGNLYAYIAGDDSLEPVLLSAHMDTVVPGNGIEPVVKDGIITSDGTTILGADDKSGIAQIIWGIKELVESGEKHPPIELLFTVCEEIGLLGVKNCDTSKFKAKKSYAFDTHEVGSVMQGAPSQKNLIITVKGKKAHAGTSPEKGINAIVAASDAIVRCPLGRIADDTTANIGIIEGGKATNIIPDSVILHGEVRSHSVDKLNLVTEDICLIFKETVKRHEVNGFQASADIEIVHKYDSFFIKESEEIIKVALKASEALGIPRSIYKGGGGSDANILNAKGIQSIVIGTGMNDVHTTAENISIESLQLGAEWVKQLLRSCCS